MSIFVQGEQGVTGNFTGFLSIRTAFEGSKSERPRPFLEVTEGLVPVFLKGDNPFSNVGLQPFLNKQVTCSGMWHRQTFVLSEISEVSTGASQTVEVSGASQVQNDHVVVKAQEGLQGVTTASETSEDSSSEE